MSNTLTARGNLGADPELKSVTVGGETRQVADMRLYCDRPVPDGDNGFKDKGGFWLSVSAWGRRGEHAARVLTKGMRITVEGTLIQNSWEKDGEQFARLELTADDIALDLARIEAVTLRQRTQAPDTDGTDTDHAGANQTEGATGGG